jgi:hypothetical protein
VKNTQYTTIFVVSNKCTTGMALEFTAGRSGAVASIVSVTPATKVLAAGAGVKVFVAHKTGSPGTGTLTLTATTDPGDSRTGVQQVTVTN